MNKGNLYLLLWLGAFCFILYQQQAVRMQVADSFNQTNTPINKANWAYPRADNIFMTQDSSGIVNYLKIAKRGNGDSLLIYKGCYTFYEPIENTIYDKIWNYDFLKIEKMYTDSLSYLSLSDFSKQKEQAHLTKSFQELPAHKEDPLYWTIFNPVVSLVTLLIFCLLIFLFNHINSWSNRRGVDRKWKFLTLFLFSIFMTLLFHRIHNFYYLIKEEQQIIRTVYIVHTFLVLFLGMVGFSFIKKKIFKVSSFSDQELFKFLSIILGGILLSTLTSFLSYHVCSYFGVTYGFSTFHWGTMVMPYPPNAWFLLASANLIVNFRKHFLQVRKEGRVVKLAQKRELESKAELDSIQASVNPHFLYNSLNSIASLAQEDPGKTEEMAIALSNFYKYNTNRKEKLWATVTDEIEMLQSYLNIEKIRFGNRLQTKLDIEESCKNILIPRFLLQPLVENAIKYGYNSEASQTAVIVIIKTNNNIFTISILDKGAPFSESLNEGYGLRMVQKKLRLLLPNKHKIDFLNEPKKEVRISIEL